MTAISPGEPRPALQVQRVRQVLAAGPATEEGSALHAMAADLEHHRSLPSTQPVALSAARPWHVVSTDEQVAGTGRLGRAWTSGRSTNLSLSVTLPIDPDHPRQGLVPALADRAGAGLVNRPQRATGSSHLGLLPLAIGVAVAEGLDHVGVPTVLKWPNDVQAAVDGRKLAGILCQVGDGGRVVVAGMGVNVLRRPSPGIATPTPGSAALEEYLVPDGQCRSDLGLRERTLIAVLQRVAHWHRWWSHEPGVVLQALTQRNATVGHQVRVELPGGEVVLGAAVGIDPSGALVVRTSTGDHRFAAGDVVHLRRAS